LRLTGWTVDPSAVTGAVVIDVQVGSSWSVITANTASAAAAAAFPAAGANHGFDATVAATAGPKSVCMYLRNVGPGTATSLGCRTVNVP
jgi:hypothetical protein